MDINVKYYQRGGGKRMMNKKIMITFIGVAALMASIVTITTPQAEAQGCTDPVEYDEKFLAQYCGDGAYLIDKETGEKSWSSGSGGVSKACDSDGQCIQVS